MPLNVGDGNFVANKDHPEKTLVEKHDPARHHRHPTARRSIRQRMWGVGALWEMKSTTGTGHVIHLTQSVDRALLLYIYEQDKKRCYIRIDTFGEVENQTGIIFLTRD